MLARLTLAALLSCSLSVAAWAQDPLIPPRDPLDHPRVIRLTKQGTTSKCIGHPVTPACAVEQVIAATLRGDVKLWTGVMMKKPYGRTKKGIAFGDHAYYRYVGGKRLTGDLVKDWGTRWEEFRCTEMMDAVEAGDLRIDVQYEYSKTGQPERLLRAEDTPEIFILRQISAQKWRVVDACTPRIDLDSDMFWLQDGE